MIRVLRPRFFIFENVRGLLSIAIRHKPLDQRSSPQEVAEEEDERLGSVLQKIVIPSFKSLGYEVIFGLLNAADYGTAQVRHRLFFIGSRDKEFRSVVFRKLTGRPMTPLDLVPATHHQYAPYNPIKPWRSLRNAVAHLSPPEPSPDLTYSYSDERAAIFKRIPPGENWTYVRDNPDRFPKGYLKKIMGNSLSSGGGKQGFWRRLAWDTPAPTLTAQPQQLATSLCHPERERPLSIPEYAALQDFPEGYVFRGGKSDRYKQIGNAVPIRLSTAICSSIRAVAGV
jgi:DNA (cytosine-5)-methyltransferase 1